MGLRRQVLLFTATRIVLNTMHRMVYPFLPALGRGLGVDLAALSLALTIRSLAGAGGPFIASLADSKGRKPAMIFSLLIFSIGMSLVLLSPTYPAFLLALLLAMLGKYTFDPSMQAYLGDRVKYARRGRVLAFTELGWSLSFILGIPLMGFVIARWGWMAPFPVLTVFGLTALGAVAWMVPRETLDPKSDSGFRNNLRQVLFYPPAVAGLGMGLLLSAANEVVNLVFGVWMEDSFGLQITALGAASALIGFSELGGESFAVLLTDRLGKPLAVALGLGLNSLAALALPILGGTLPGALSALFFFYITFEYALVSSIPMMTEVLPALRATMMAANTAGLSLGRAIGAFLAPPLYLSARALGVPEILPGALAAVALNFLALLALRRLQKAQSSDAAVI